MNRDDDVSLYGKRAARTIARFRLDDPEAIKAADAKVQQWTPWAYRYAKNYLQMKPRVAAAIKLSGCTMSDVYQAALYGMTKASRTHADETYAFSAWAVWDMRKEIQRLAVRKSVRTTSTEEDRNDYTGMNTHERLSNPYDLVVHKEYHEFAKSLVDRLPWPYSEIIKDHFNDVVQDETVSKVKVSKRTLRKYRLQAMEWLQYFAGVGPEPDKE
jgi:RNA polymerase sigma factor (sigma-70 family)